eukprot:gene9490-10482_t
MATPGNKYACDGFDTHKGWCIIFVLITLHATAFSHPILRRSLSTQRELVKRLQLQSILKHLEGKDSDLSFAAALDEEFRKRAAERDVQFPPPTEAKTAFITRDTAASNEDLQEDNSPRQTRSTTNENDKANVGKSNIDWDIVNRNVPFNVPPVNKNSLSKRGAPCRKKRSLSEVEGGRERRSLKTPPGQGLVPQYNLYEEICEDSQPVEVVKIKKLIVEDGVIRDNDIVEPSMLQ